MRAWGITFWLIAGLTLVNYFACPRFLDGSTEVPRRDWHGNYSGGGQPVFEKLDGTRFAAMEIFLCSIVVGGCLLRARFPSFLAGVRDVLGWENEGSFDARSAGATRETDWGVPPSAKP